MLLKLKNAKNEDICAHKINFMPHNIHIIKPHAIILNKYL